MRAAGYAPYVAQEPSGPAIRLTSPAGDEYCPFTAVYGHCTGRNCPPARSYSSIEHLGLSPYDAYALTTAADLRAAEPHLRSRLLAALALEEAPARPDER
jgi:hypothetical protein